ncbi:MULTISPECIES: hypothetical protein [Bacillales]|uniref:hypothetical protein n=1 Tax=Bacillales TaxID=1385 RepID=UPI0003E24A42|nr:MULTISPECIES: hypothetical protein [Paenibacillus]ETT59924.1 hypothetical protein C172_23858 [Paenibacillus sp. FSL H8-457]MCM3261067.1 hypothetical protein [Paenibacillus lautus]
MYTHILSSKLETEQRKDLVKKIILFFCKECKYLKIRCWAQDDADAPFLKKQTVQRTFGDDGLLELRVPIDKEVVDFFNHYEMSETESYILPFFHLEFLDEQKNVQLYCGDSGSDVLFDEATFNAPQLFDLISEEHFNKLN